jgi:hypothetical protein
MFDIEAEIKKATEEYRASRNLEPLKYPTKQSCPEYWDELAERRLARLAEQDNDVARPE